MPTYDYHCADCGGFDALRSLAQRNEPAACPECGAPSPRVFASAPRLACLGPEQRRAHDTNERARHAPRSSRDAEAGSYGRLRHPAGCGCCSGGGGGKRSATVTAPNGAKAFPSKRPWMISH
ncbi:FmdB family transcriptional regulator [Paracidovorax avenae]|uniref:FmdB family zinc ribbon protein n=1 Tax=Paracidovorax avenae TaxID=80867 RepID=UPI000D22C14B|nr:zinc ribbon domain-containing protein [Paracidovorax avenae]AVS65129.1 FmdB family transcriptional regulator [Paracidovorax avenae]